MGVAKGEVGGAMVSAGVGVAKNEDVREKFQSTCTVYIEYLRTVCAPLGDGGGRPGQSYEQAVPKQTRRWGTTR